MFAIEDILKVGKKVNTYCKEIDKLEQANRESYAREVDNITASTEKMREDMEANYAKFCKKQFQPVREELNDVIDLIKKDYPNEANSALTAAKKKKDEFRGGGVSELKEKLYGYLAKINSYIKKLNDLNFDELVPPIRIETFDDTSEEFTAIHATQDSKREVYKYNENEKAAHKEEFIDPKCLSAWAKPICLVCGEALECLAALEKSHESYFDFSDFDKYITSQKNAWLSETKARMNSEYDKKFDDFFRNEEAGAIKRSFFSELEKCGQESDVDPKVGSATYNENINIGDLKLSVEKDRRHLDYIAQSPTLSKYMGDGYIKCPLILELKKCGNILLNISNNDYNKNTVDFVNQLILQFLLSFPANRINFCLVDVENRMNFSQYKSLTKINNNILFDGIIRDDRQLENTIKDLEQIMYKIEDDNLSYNNVKDIYEYNKKFEANPQNVHLFVLVNYPSGIRDDTAKRILKIMQNGNKTGIFTIIINNDEAQLSPGFKESDSDQFLSEASANALVINNSGSKFTLEISAPNEVIPKRELNAVSLNSIIDMLKDMAESNKQKVVPLSQMFADTDALAKKQKGIARSEEVLDIPIGARGGEIQNLLLKTTGDGSAHAVLIGGTGSGKSNLLHTIIMSACYKYSPEELNLYLVDFKGGVEFKYYEANKVREKQIPHIKLTGLTSDLEDGVAILNNLHKELRRREDEFRKCRVEDIVQYKSIGKSMPRLFVIIDEIQELFEQDDRLGQKAIDILRELFKKGRAFGINILWASQNIPKTPGLKDKVLSQIGNRISLRLNEPDDAIDIKIDPKVVRNLNRPEKGLGVINDIRYGNESVEFRVAYAENSENRQKYSQLIIDKWKSVKGEFSKEPLYIVGDDDEPSPIMGNTIYNYKPTKKDIVSKSFDKYSLQLGQDYVTGQPYAMDIALRESKENILLAGYDIEIIRDMMGYSLLSVLMNHITNADCLNKDVKLYYANGGNVIENVSSPAQIKDCIKEIYKNYKLRSAESDNSEYAKNYTPYFVIIHSLQRYTDLFNENPILRLSDKEEEKPAPSFMPSSGGLDAALSLFASANAPKAAADNLSNGVPDSVHFADAFKELLDRGGKFGVHFIISIDNPLGIQQLSKNIQEMKYKVFVKGINANIMSQVLGDYKVSNSLTNPKVALVAMQDEHTKIRVYRYEDENDKNWYSTLCKNYKALIEG